MEHKLDPALYWKYRAMAEMRERARFQAQEHIANAERVFQEVVDEIQVVFPDFDRQATYSAVDATCSLQRPDAPVSLVIDKPSRSKKR